MNKSQFIEIAEKHSFQIAQDITPSYKRIKNEQVKELIMTAYYSGCLNTFDQIQSDPSIIRRKIGFIK